MNTKSISRYVLALFVAFAVGSNAEARRGERGGKGSMHKKVMKELNLTVEQKEKIAIIRGEERKARKAKREQRKELKESMHQAIVNFNESEMRKAHNQLEELRANHNNKRFENLIKLLKILTPEQRKEFAELNKKYKDRRNGRRGMNRGFGE